MHGHQGYCRADYGRGLGSWCGDGQAPVRRRRVRGAGGPARLGRGRLCRRAERLAKDRVDAPGAGEPPEPANKAVFVPADVTNEAQVQAAVDAAVALGPLRIVVNCAGIATPGKVLGRDGVLPLENFSRVIQINLVGTFNVIRLAAAAMAATEPASTELGGPERGVIINTASVAAFDGQIGQPAYAASKGAVAAMTLPIARELARSLIRVVTIAPGHFRDAHDGRAAAGGPGFARASRCRTPPGWAGLPSTRTWRRTSWTTPCSTARPSASTAPSGWGRSDAGRRRRGRRPRLAASVDGWAAHGRLLRLRIAAQRRGAGEAGASCGSSWPPRSPRSPRTGGTRPNSPRTSCPSWPPWSSAPRPSAATATCSPGW